MVGNSFGLVPLRDKVTVTKQSVTPLLDDWGEPIYETESMEYPCNFTYNYKNETASNYEGKLIVYTAKIYIKGLVKLDKQDKIQFIDMADNIVEKEIVTAYPVRDMAGKVLYTCVLI